MIKDQLLSALVERGLFSSDVGVVTSPKSEEVGLAEQVRLKELELELRRLDLNEKDTDSGLKTRQLEEETKRVVRLKELELNAAMSQQSPQLSSQHSPDFDVTRHIRLVLVFREEDVQ